MKSDLHAVQHKNKQGFKRTLFNGDKTMQYKKTDKNISIFLER